MSRRAGLKGIWACLLAPQAMADRIFGILQVDALAADVLDRHSTEHQSLSFAGGTGLLGHGHVQELLQ